LQVWTVSNQKGGVGKTTSTVALGGLAAQAGKRALLVDLDPHGSLTSWFRQDPDAEGDSVYTLFQQQAPLSRETVTRAIYHTPFNNLALLRASTLLATLERQSIAQGRGLILGKSLALVAADYDLVIMDCPPQLGILMVNALAACQQLVIPVQTEFLAIKGLERILHTLDMMGQSLKKTFNYCIVPTMFDRRTQASVSSLRTIRYEYGEWVWPGMIRVDTRLRDASKAGIPPGIFNPDSHASEDYRSLYKYLDRTVTKSEAKALP